MSLRLRDALAPLGLMPAQAAALIEIGQKPGLTQKELVERLEVEQPGVARTLNGLEADGWIFREARGGRAQGLYLSDRAAVVVPEAARVTAEINRKVLAELSRTEQANLLRCDRRADFATSRPLMRLPRAFPLYRRRF